MSNLLHILLSLTLLPAVAPLFCYTCVFPTKSPADCIAFPLDCPPGQLCLSSRAQGQRGGLPVVLYERSCALPALCGLRGETISTAMNFTFTNDCCDTPLCNRGDSAPCWTLSALTLLATRPLW